MLAERLRLLSPFRWRLEWAALLIAAVAGALSEQAMEARQRDPYQVVMSGLGAKASVTSGRAETVSLGVRRGVPIEETHTYLDLDWEDRGGARRIVANYRLDPETIVGLGIDIAAQRWPARVDILYLDRPRTMSMTATSVVVEQGVTASDFQRRCKPLKHCRLVVLTPEVLTPTEIAAMNVDYVLLRAPHAFSLSLVIFAMMLCLRLLGIVYNRPSLE